jgi:hypothetical protein
MDRVHPDRQGLFFAKMEDKWRRCFNLGFGSCTSEGSVLQWRVFFREIQTVGISWYRISILFLGLIFEFPQCFCSKLSRDLEIGLHVFKRKLRILFTFSRRGENEFTHLEKTTNKSVFPLRSLSKKELKYTTKRKTHKCNRNKEQNSEDKCNSKASEAKEMMGFKAKEQNDRARSQVELETHAFKNWKWDFKPISPGIFGVAEIIDSKGP